MYSFIFFLLVPFVFAAQKRSPCCTSNQFEAVISEIGGNVDPNTGNVTIIDFSAKLTFDYDRKRIRADRLVNNVVVSVLSDYNEMMSYTVIQGKCTASTLNQTMTPPCVPDKSDFLGMNFLGSVHNGQHLDMLTWRADMTSTIGLTMKISVTEDDCSPLSESMYGIVNGMPTQLTYFFSNFTTGISSANRNLLEKPAMCSHAAAAVGKRSYEEDMPLLTFFQN